jgi:hypothetical protein
MKSIVCGAVFLAMACAACLGLGQPASAAGACIRAGGEGNGVLQDFASFMANAAMKNQAKAWGGDNVKISAAKTTCKQENLLYVCKAFAKACK